MGTPIYTSEYIKDEPVPAARSQDVARQRRLAALQAAQGLWKDRTDVPNDGVEYQEQLRAEWR